MTRGTGVTVNSVLPGPTRSEGVETFVEQMAQFVRSHPRTQLIAYFNAKQGSIFDLATKPRSLAAYKRLIVPLGR